MSKPKPRTPLLIEIDQTQNEIHTQNLLTPSNRVKQFQISEKVAKTQRSHQQQIPSEQADKQLIKEMMNRMFIGKQDNYTPMQIEIHRQIITNMWDYRYWKLVDYAVQTKDWLKVFSFLGEFKQKCLNIAKMLVNQKFKIPQIDTIDHRYEAKQPGQVGIYNFDGITIRVARESQTKGSIEKKAVKNLHQEFLGANVVNNLILSLRTQMPRLPVFKVPLHCLIKYLGYTFLFQADTPCQGLQTLINGPMNITYQYCQQIQPILQMIGHNLNLKPFKIYKDNKQIDIPFSLTLQTHQIKTALKDIALLDWINPDSLLYPTNQKENILNKPEYYMMSFSKLWPLFINSNIVSSSGYLRPEIVLSWKKQLSNIVFSNVCFEKDQIGELELAEACKYVKEDVIKIVTKMLDQATYFTLDSCAIEELMHEYGLNMSLLGQVTSKFTLDCNKRIFQTQMAARILKKLFYISARQFEEEEDIKELYIDFLNLVFINNYEGQKFWRNSVYKNIQKCYQYQINQYPPAFPGGGLLHALNYHCGIKIKIIDYALFKEVDHIFQVSNIIDLYGIAKTYDMETSELKKYCQNYKSKKREGMFTQAIDCLNLLIGITKRLYPANTFQLSSRPESFYYSELAQCYRNMEQYEKAMEYSLLALDGIPDKHADSIKPYCVLVRCYSQKKEMNRCVEYYEKSLAALGFHLAPNHPLTISVYNTLGFEFLSSNDPGRCEKIFAKSFQISEQALGYMHMNSGRILMQLADLPLPPEKTIGFLLRALTILQNIEEDKQKVKKVCMRISQLYYKTGNLTKQLHFARRSGHWKMQILALQKLNQYKAVMQLCHKIPNDTIDLAFLVQKCFFSYIKLIQYVPSNNLYKLSISLKQNLPPRQVALEKTLKMLNSQINPSQTVVDLVKYSLSNLIAVIPQYLVHEDFYMGYDYLKNIKNLKFQKSLKLFLDILAIVGIKKAEEIFIEFKKTF